MAEITERAYQNLREHIINTWNHIELQDDNDKNILRMSVDDPRLSWTHEHGTEEGVIDHDDLGRPIYGDVPIQDNPILKLQIIIKGSDEDIALPSTVARSIIYDRAGTERLIMSSETFTPFTMETEDDELTIVHNIEVPQSL